MDTARKTLRWLPAFLILVLVPVAALIMGTSAEATVDHAPAVMTHVSLHAAPADRETLQVDVLSPDNDALVRYIFDSMRTWTKLPSDGSDPVGDDARVARNASARARQASTAGDIVSVVRSEQALFEGDTDRSRTAVLVAALAFFESGFAEYVDAGQCNDWSWKHPRTTGPDAVPADEVKRRKSLLASGPCDGGFAYSDWQIHPFDSIWRDGLVLLDGPRSWSFAADVGDVQEHEIIHGKDMIEDRRKAARVALHMLRRAMGTGRSNLCGYTGESGSCPKGAQRMKFALDWSSRHPFSGS